MNEQFLSLELLNEIEEQRKAEQEAVTAEAVKKSSQPPSPVVSDKDVEAAFYRNQKGDAELFVKLAGNKFICDARFATENNAQWYEFIGNYWKEDVTGNAIAFVDNVADIYAGLAIRKNKEAEIWDKKGRSLEANAAKKFAEKLNARAFSLRSVARVKNVLKFAHSGVGSLAFSQEWDDHPTLFPVKNGVVDLETGKLFNGSPEQYMRTFSGIEYVVGKNIETPVWDDLIQKVFCKNEQLIDYFERAVLGVCAVGEATKDLFIAYGPGGNNGKSVLFDTIVKILGGFATTFPVETLLDSGTVRSAAAAAPDLIQFCGKRFAMTSEAEQKHRFSMSRIKQICSGGDEIAARELFAARSTHFKITHSTLIHTNFLPKASGNDGAFYNRTKILKFDAQFVPSGGQIKPNEEAFIYPAMPRQKLEAALQAEASGILAHIVRAAMRFLRDRDLSVPSCVLNEGAAYREDQDVAGRFLDACCEPAPDFRTPMTDIYAAFVKYCVETENIERKKVFSQIWLGREMQNRPQFPLIMKRPKQIYGLRINLSAVCDPAEREYWKLA